MIINTENDYWKIVDAHWDDISHIIFYHLDYFAPAYDDPGNPTTSLTGRNIRDELDYLRSTKDKKLARYFNSVWCMASDNYAWSVPNWGRFCDLCSETWVFDCE